LIVVNAAQASQVLDETQRYSGLPLAHLWLTFGVSGQPPLSTTVEQVVLAETHPYDAKVSDKRPTAQQQQRRSCKDTHCGSGLDEQ
jgi:hypothetical protein